MTYILSLIPGIFKYGWASTAIAGVGLACLLSLSLSMWLLAWRYVAPDGETGMAKMGAKLEGNLTDEMLDEIEITPEMIRAGAAVLEELCDSESHFVARRVFEAMLDCVSLPRLAEEDKAAL